MSELLITSPTVRAWHGSLKEVKTKSEEKTIIHTPLLRSSLSLYSLVAFDTLN